MKMPSREVRPIGGTPSRKIYRYSIPPYLNLTFCGKARCTGPNHITRWRRVDHSRDAIVQWSCGMASDALVLSSPLLRPISGSLEFAKRLFYRAPTPSDEILSTYVVVYICIPFSLNGIQLVGRVVYMGYQWILRSSPHPTRKEHQLHFFSPPPGLRIKKRLEPTVPFNRRPLSEERMTVWEVRGGLKIVQVVSLFFPSNH